MNAITQVEDHDNALVSRADRSEMVRVLQNSHYPGAKAESVELVLSYCRVNRIDPMLKAVHIVPMWDKNSRTMRDVLMPGIADYRIKAARSDRYAGKSEPDFGPDVTRRWGNVEVTFPLWCKVTVRRFVAGHMADFTAKEFWIENYAQFKRDDPTPNSTWQRRPYGQLAKCAEAQALRMAFPELSGGAPTAEEMEGKSFEGHTIDGHAEQSRRAPPPPPPARHADEDVPTLDDEPAGNRYPLATAKFAKDFATPAEWVAGWRKLVANCRAADALDKLAEVMRMNEANFHAVQAFDAAAVEDVRGLVLDALTPPPAPEPPPAADADFPDAPPADDIPSMEDAAPAEPQPAAEPDKDREWTTRMLGEIAKARTNPRWWREKMPGKLARLEAERPELLEELEQAENDRAAELVMGEPA